MRRSVLAAVAIAALGCGPEPVVPCDAPCTSLVTLGWRVERPIVRLRFALIELCIDANCATGWPPDRSFVVAGHSEWSIAMADVGDGKTHVLLFARDDGDKFVDGEEYRVTMRDDTGAVLYTGRMAASYQVTPMCGAHAACYRADLELP